MRILVVGGTVFLGRHLVSLAVAAGHEVTTLNRGTNDLAEQSSIERLIADRDGDLSLLAGRTFDAVIDTCGYRPESVAHTVGSLFRSVGTYVFISTISVFGEFTKIGLKEEDPIKYTESGTEGSYGSLKADCERVLESLIPDRALIIRPGLIAGPHDPTDRFTYWPARFARGGQIAVPDRATERFVQFIDVRDLASFAIKLTEAQARGIYIATGPNERLTLQGLFDACELKCGTRDFQVVRVDDVVFEKAGVEPWTELPLWIPTAKKSFAGVMRLDRTKAAESGLVCRPVASTVADTLAWDRQRDPNAPRQAGLSEEKEAKLLRQPKRILDIGRGPLPGEGLK